MDFASDDIFKRCFRRYNGNYKAKDFSCWKQFLCMAFDNLLIGRASATQQWAYGLIYFVVDVFEQAQRRDHILFRKSETHYSLIL
ncbi:MAG: DUF4372 domain-containing protein [bacterium]